MTNTGSCWLKGSQLIIGFIVITGCLVTPSGFCSECKVLCVSPVFTVLSTLPRDPLKKKEGKEKGGGKKRYLLFANTPTPLWQSHSISSILQLGHGDTARQRPTASRILAHMRKASRSSRCGCSALGWGSEHRSPDSGAAVRTVSYPGLCPC